jgi:hypothetical protein
MSRLNKHNSVEKYNAELRALRAEIVELEKDLNSFIDYGPAANEPMHYTLQEQLSTVFSESTTPRQAAAILRTNIKTKTHFGEPDRVTV